MSSKEIQDLNYQERKSKRQISDGAEKWLGKVIPVFDYGFVYLVDYMGNDNSIEEAARVSYGTGTRKVSQTRGLIRYLLRHHHTTPFEMVEFKFHAKMPLFVARQWIRHRTANVNEYSARYSILDKEFYIPDVNAIAEQSSSNRQGRGDKLNPDQAKKVQNMLMEDAAQTYDTYERLLDMGVARELARANLPVNIYTQWYWKIDLHNLLNFLNLRMDPHAQYEIREYANAIATIVKDSVPIAWEAFQDYKTESLSLSRLEKELIKMILENDVEVDGEGIVRLANDIGLSNTRELNEAISKLKQLGFIN